MGFSVVAQSLGYGKGWKGWKGGRGEGVEVDSTEIFSVPKAWLTEWHWWVLELLWALRLHLSSYTCISKCLEKQNGLVLIDDLWPVVCVVQKYCSFFCFETKFYENVCCTKTEDPLLVFVFPFPFAEICIILSYFQTTAEASPQWSEDE